MDWIDVHEADLFLINVCTEKSVKHEALHLLLVQGETNPFWKCVTSFDLPEE
ncbi:hypothetical protein B7P43_G11071 [Cryptotermes secundus]|uniref:Uncharacterized protein n=1 Tax=Cryptotermes secundus TaxID=105785 RepID=A0A2J7RF53_9NEOP|nr:hypothetical protein B7P43_G11071 [Cryptotermes secundus]